MVLLNTLPRILVSLKILFYKTPPRKSAASYRADEWVVNKWAWEGILKVIRKGEECIIRLEDKNTGELYARAFLRNGEPHPVEPVIDSSRYFVLRIEEKIDHVAANGHGNKKKLARITVGGIIFRLTDMCLQNHTQKARGNKNNLQQALRKYTEEGRHRSANI